jgi:hypothetical protein
MFAMAPLISVLPSAPLWLALVVAAALGFAAGKWWIALLAGAWPLYGSHVSDIQLEGSLEVWLAITTTLIVILAMELGVALRWMIRRRRASSRHSPGPAFGSVT